jgi:hypothetical protein
MKLEQNSFKVHKNVLKKITKKASIGLQDITAIDTIPQQKSS